MQVNANLNMAGYSGDQLPVMQKRILDAVKTIPGVTVAAYANRIPLNLGWSQNAAFLDSTTDYRMANKAAGAIEYDVSPDYFEAAATLLLRGRAFTWNDSKERTARGSGQSGICAQAFRIGEKAIGSFFKIGNGARVQVVGLVEDGKYGTLSEAPKPAMFLPILQSPSNAMWLLVRSNLYFAGRRAFAGTYTARA